MKTNQQSSKLKKSWLLFGFTFLFLLFSVNTNAQPGKEVHGIIKNSDGKPLIDVSIGIKGTNIVVLSDGDGRYNIKVNKGATLEFTYVGMGKKDVVVGNSNQIDISLSPASDTLGEVVVIGYGTATKKDVTGAVFNLDNTKLEDLPNTNITQALQGKIPGVSISATGRAGSGQAINIRGENSITASNNALIVVDGVIYDGSLADINPNDIASFNVLRDASSTAIFGSRAANGVVIISTKKGKSPNPTIQVNGYSGYQSFLMNEKLENPAQYIQKILNYQKLLAFRGVAPQPDISHPEKYLNAAEVYNFENGKSLEPFDVISRSAPTQNYNMNISANTGKTNYYIAGTWTDQKGKVVGDRFKRAALRINFETHITNWLKFGTNSSFTFIDNSGSPADLVQASRLSPYATWYLDSAKKVLNPFPMTDNFVSNPLLPTLNSNINQRKNLFGIFYGEVAIPFIDGLTYRFTYSNNLISSKNYSFVPSFNAGGVNRVASAGDGYSETQDMYLQNLLKYNHTFATNHNLDVTLLYDYNLATSNGLSANANTFPTDVLNFYSLSLGANQATNASYSDYHAIAMMARANYKYKGRYLLTLTGRKDGASVFSESSKYAFFPSAAVAWVISQEEFMKNNNAVNFLKLRLSYGANGNQGINRYGSLSVVSTNNAYNYTYDGTTTAYGLAKTSLGNPNLKWESTYATNYGADFELFKSRISGAINYYNSKTKDLLLNRRIPTLNGFSSFLSNLGEVSNKGIEINLNTVNVKNRNFEWEMGINFAHNKNSIVHLYGTRDVNGKETDDIANSWFIGKSLGAYYSYVPDGIWQINDSLSMPNGFKAGDVRLKDLDKDGVITANGDRRILGYDKPDFTFGFSNTIRYKEFSLYAQISGSIGGVRNNDALLNPAAGLAYRVRSAYINWWTPDNPSDVHPSIDYQSAYNFPFLQSTTFVRIQDISLSYNFPQHLLDRIKLNSLKLYLSSKNPFLFTKWQGWDPESSQSGLGQFPTMKSIIAGINISL